MKKLITIVLISLVSSLAITSCTEEQIEPKSYNGGGGGIDPKP